jgi:CHAD domain-containing protein
MAVVREVETELKYEVDAEPPPLADLPGVSDVDGPTDVRLSAVYFDTADLRLRRHGATLRRRTGGADEGWHLKVPVGGDSRVELRLPLEADPRAATNAPPDELADLTFGMVRGAEIRPVALVKTRRRIWRLTDEKGRFVAEVALDRVTARRLDDSSSEDKWREMEVEFADPDDVPAFDRALRKAGLRRAQHSSKLGRVLPATATPPVGDTAGDAVLAYLRAQFDEIVKQDLRVRRDEPDSVHRMRVATRKLRSALRVYRRLLPGTERLATELRWLGQRLADARDLEVQEGHFKEVVAALPPELVVGAVGARFVRHFGPAREEARQTVLSTLGDKRYRVMLDSLDRLVNDPRLAARAARPAAEELPKHLRRAYRKTERRVAADTPHQARKAAKRYRYGLEVAEPAVGKRAANARKAARDLTKVLGEHQDGVVAQPVLRELGMQAHLAGENGFTFGLLHERESARCAEAERVYPEHWERVRKTRLR